MCSVSGVKENKRTDLLTSPTSTFLIILSPDSLSVNKLNYALLAVGSQDDRIRRIVTVMKLSTILFTPLVIGYYSQWATSNPIFYLTPDIDMLIEFIPLEPGIIEREEIPSDLGERFIRRVEGERHEIKNMMGGLALTAVIISYALTLTQPMIMN